MPPDDKKSPPQDIAVLCGPTEDGKGARILRARDGNLEAGEVRPVKEGQPLNQGELVRLVPRKDAPAVCDVETLHKVESPVQGPSTSPPHAGRPAQVATDDYRANWERTFDSRARGPKRDKTLN